MAMDTLKTKPREADSQFHLFEACKNGNLEAVRKHVTVENVNARDVAGRKSTPLHFAAGKPTV